MGRRKKNDFSGLGIILLVGISLIIVAIQRAGWWLVAISAVALIVYLIYRYSKKTDSNGNTEVERQKKPEPFSTWASSQGLSSGVNTYPVQKKVENARWIPKGSSIQVQGYNIQDGMLYYGESWVSTNGSASDPALIDPNLQINKSNPDQTASTMPYWPSYSSISPSARAAFLEWLSSGRSNANVGIGYVFLFFYGLERRALRDAQESSDARAEIPVIVTEVKRLLRIYGNSSGSFHGYATSFLSYLSTYSQDSNYNFLDDATAPNYELPFALKRALGQLSLKAKPIPESLAFAWFERSPDISLRTPAKRCREEFVKLFKSRYKLEFGEGMIINPNKTLLRCEYHPASSSFMGKTFSNQLDGIPDITKLSKPISTLQKIADTCMEDLEAYSRFLGRKAENQENKIFALAQLPPEILREGQYAEIEKLSSFLQNATRTVHIQTVEFSGLLSALGLPSDQPLTSSESLLVAQLLGRIGYGLEPDIRFGGNKIVPAQKAVVFKLKDTQASAASPEYSFAALLLSFSSLIIHADGSVNATEEEKLRSHLSTILSLTEGEKQRIDALLVHLCTAPPPFASVKKRIDALTSESKTAILNFLISVTNADGNIDPSEIKVLKKIYELFGKKGDQIYSDIHAFQTTGDAPVTIAPADPSLTGFAIPKKKYAKQRNDGVTLDMNLVAKTLQQTQEVQSLLSNIFSENDETVTDAPKTETIKGIHIANLDSSHSDLLSNISTLDSISVDDFHNLCKQLSILPSGAIELINNAGFDKVNDIYIEETDDMLILNKEIAKEIMA